MMEAFGTCLPTGKIGQQFLKKILDEDSFQHQENNTFWFCIKRPENNILVFVFTSLSCYINATELELQIIELQLQSS